MREVTVAELRDIVADLIASTIETHRIARRARVPSEAHHSGLPDDDEITDFIFSNPYFDEDTIDHLVDPGLLGFHWNKAQASEEWIDEFKTKVSSWASNHTWLDAALPWLVHSTAPAGIEHDLWLPAAGQQPLWVQRSPTCLLIAGELLRQGRLLSEMPWRSFEELIGALLEVEGWEVTVTRPTRDGGVDVIATRTDATLGQLRSVWQAKRYGPRNKVKLREVRELAAIRDDHKASKALIVTTSWLTRDAIEWVQRDAYRFGYKEHSDLEKWIRRRFV